MQDSTEEAIFLSSSGDAEILRPSKAASRQECCGEVRSFTRPAGKGMYARGKGGYAYGFSSHPQTILVPYDCWQSDEVHPGCAWIEVVAPAGKALAQLQVTLPVQLTQRIPKNYSYRFSNLEQSPNKPLMVRIEHSMNSIESFSPARGLSFDDEDAFRSLLGSMLEQQLEDYFLRHHHVFQQQVLASLQHSRLSDELTAADLAEASASIVAVPRTERGPVKNGSSKLTYSRQGSHLSCGDTDTEPPRLPSLRSPHHSIDSRQKRTRRQADEGPMPLVVPSVPLALPAPRLPGAPEELSREALASPGESSGSLKAPKPAVSDRTLNMQIIERVSHVCILNSQSVNHVEEALEDEIGCKLLIAVRRPMFGVVGLLALSAGILLVLFASAGFACSSSYGMTIASTVLYGLLSVCCSGLLRHALLSEDLHLAFSKLSRFGSANLQGEWFAKRVLERRRYVIFAVFLAANMCGTWALDFWSSLEGCEEQGGHPGPMMYSVAALSLISFVVSSSLVVLAAYIHSQLLIGLDLILDFWVSDVVTNADALGWADWTSAKVSAAGIPCKRSCPQKGDGQTAEFPAAGRCAQAIRRGQNIDVHRQYLVRFITDSAAGFIVKGVTLTQAIFLRQVYFLGTLFSGLLGVLIRIYL
ncbi:hypothetical protein AK812_SmicGene161 [Symbiodinium microadriaticum]|uniref:Transmembrane protein n=1 Tax=Symbiodinium microadriaticum TaxID=2951 RepID=A0A1Q9F7E8_SYMMI|nr:hypothetical protein AK812_SmicGene161 [Symbiodinium microadriaticum]